MRWSDLHWERRIEYVKSLLSAASFYGDEIDRFTPKTEKSWVNTGLCPFHNDTRPGSFSVNLDSGAYRCFSCDAAGGDIIAFYQARYTCGFKEALEALEERAGIPPNHVLPPTPPRPSKADGALWSPPPPPPKRAAASPSFSRQNHRAGRFVGSVGSLRGTFPKKPELRLRVRTNSPGVEGAFVDEDLDTSENSSLDDALSELSPKNAPGEEGSVSAVGSLSVPHPDKIPAEKRSPKWESYRYCHGDGSVYCTVTRHDREDGTKFFKVMPTGLVGPHPLYRSECLEAASAETTVYVVEGEKCVHALESVGLLATTSKGGAKAAGKSDWSGLAKFRKIILLPDNDKAGRGFAKDVTEQLAALAGQREVLICPLPDLPEKGDVADFLEQHSVEDLKAAIKDHGRPVPVSVVEGLTWPEPKAFAAAAVEVPEVDREMLPDSIAPWCFDAAERMQAPVDYMAVSALCMLGGLIGRQLCIRAKSLDDWAVTPNIWGAIIGVPAMMKSPCLKEARRFLDMLDRESVAAHTAEQEVYAREMCLYEGELEAFTRDMKKTCTKAERKLMVQSRPEAPEAPTRRRSYTQDVTVEKLQELQRENPRGISMLRDELGGFLKSLDKPGQESSRAYILEGWEGDGRFLVDRIGRGSIAIEGICLSVLGCTTPGGMSEYVKEAFSNGTGADGLMQRFSLIAYPKKIYSFDYVDRPRDEEAAKAAEEAFRICDTIDLQGIGATVYPDSLPFLRYSDEAQGRFESWYTELVRRCRTGYDHPAMESHLAKFSKLVPALSLICHVADGHQGPVSEAAFLRAAAWAAYAEGHARRLYMDAFKPEHDEAPLELLRHIKAGDLTEKFSLRDLYRKEWGQLSTKEAAKSAVNELIETGHLREITEKKATGGRPSTSYVIHPMYRHVNRE